MKINDDDNKNNNNKLQTHYIIFNLKPVESRLSLFTTPKITYKNFK